MRNLKRHTVVAEAKVEHSQPTVQDAAPPAVSVEDADTASADHLCRRRTGADTERSGNWHTRRRKSVGRTLPRRPTSMLSILPPIKPAPHRRMRRRLSRPMRRQLTPRRAPRLPLYRRPPLPSSAIPRQRPISSKSPLPRLSHRPPALAVGSPGWIAQVMAALAGAVAAGTIAWFLIGSAPQRTYG